MGFDLHLFQTRFVIGWENNGNGDITMPLSLKTTGSAGYKDQWNKRFGRVLVKNMHRSLWNENHPSGRQRVKHFGDSLTCCNVRNFQILEFIPKFFRFLFQIVDSQSIVRSHLLIWGEKNSWSTHYNLNKKSTWALGRTNHIYGKKC